MAKKKKSSKPTKKQRQKQPLVGHLVSAGFPSPADEYIEKDLDLHEYLVKKPAATFFIKVKGESMIGAGIFAGDLLVVDRSIEPINNHVVLASVNGEFTLKRLIKRGQKIFLQPENPKNKIIEINGSTEFQIFGVVTHNIHHLL